MRIVFCGVRGSTPVHGRQYLRYGGYTSSVSLAHDGQPPTLLLDAGTGLSQASSLLGDAPFVGTILIGHLHWDHTQGLPFFSAGVRPDASVTVLLPDHGDDAEEVLARAFSPPHFPIRPSQLAGAWRFRGLAPGDHLLEGFSVTALDIPHPGGRTFGFRVRDANAVVAYLSDHSPLMVGEGPEGLGEYHEAALALARGADLLIHDAQHTAAELPTRAYLGHSAVEYAVGLAEAAGVGLLALFHHDPSRTDSELDAIVARQRSDRVAVIGAAESMVIDLPLAARRSSTGTAVATVSSPSSLES